MYLEHFGLREFPFSITPDTSYFFSSAVSQEALNTLLFAARSGEGFIKITGEVGTGKTLLCRKLIATLENEFRIAYIPNPYLEPQALFTELASEFEIPLENLAGLSQHQLLRQLTREVVEIVRSGKRVLILLDETQSMPIETLEALRLLTNLETEKRKLLQVIIFGQPELEEKLNHPSIRQLKQRIVFHYKLSPMTGNELDFYLRHRLEVAGYRGRLMFSRMALWLIRQQSKKVPRLINIIAHKSLLSAYGKGTRRVGFFDVLDAARDTAYLDGRDYSRDLHQNKFLLPVLVFLLVAAGIYWGLQK